MIQLLEFTIFTIKIQKIGGAGYGPCSHVSVSKQSSIQWDPSLIWCNGAEDTKEWAGTRIFRTLPPPPLQLPKLTASIELSHLGSRRLQESWQGCVSEAGWYTGCSRIWWDFHRGCSPTQWSIIVWAFQEEQGTLLSICIEQNLYYWATLEEIWSCCLIGAERLTGVCHT